MERLLVTKKISFNGVSVRIWLLVRILYFNIKKEEIVNM